MSDVEKIVSLLANEAIEKRIAAAIVLGEIKAKGVNVSEALAATLDSGIAPLQRHALHALGRIGAKKAASKIVPLLGAREEDVRRAAVEAMVSIGDDVLPAIRERMGEAGPEERRSIDSILAALGGKDAFHTLLDGLAGGDAEAAKAAAIAVRQRVGGRRREAAEKLSRRSRAVPREASEKGGRRRSHRRRREDSGLPRGRTRHPHFVGVHGGQEERAERPARGAHRASVSARQEGGR